MSTVVITYGRFQPVTRAHVLLFQFMNTYYGTKIVCTSNTKDSKRNPLHYTEKLSLLRRCTKHDVHLYTDPFDAITKLANYYDHIIMVCGSDRVEKYQDFLKYVKHPDPLKKIPYLRSLKIVSFGDRDPDTEIATDDIEGVSASKARQAAIEGNLLAFGKIVPECLKFDEVVSLYIQVSRGLGITNEANT